MAKEYNQEINGTILNVQQAGAPFGVSQSILWRPYFTLYHIGLP